MTQTFTPRQGCGLNPYCRGCPQCIEQRLGRCWTCGAPAPSDRHLCSRECEDVARMFSELEESERSARDLKRELDRHQSQLRDFELKLIAEKRRAPQAVAWGAVLGLLTAHVIHWLGHQ